MPADKDDKSEKETRTKVGIGTTEIDRDYPDDEYDDYGARARQNAREFGENVRDAGRSVRREGTDIFSAYCDVIGGIFIGIGEAIAPRRRSGSADSGYGSTCAPITSCAGASRQSSDEPAQSSSYSAGGGRVSASRTEARRRR